jgi:putative sigma-54 modulation protein
MTIDIRFRGLANSDALRAHIVRRIHFQLRRLGRALSAVVVRVSDVNGPKGGVDKRCQVMLRRPGHPPVTIDEVSVDAYAAADVAVERAALAVERGRERERAVRRRWVGPRWHAVA